MSRVGRSVGMLFYFGEDQSTHIMYTFLLREKYYFHRFSDNQVAINLDPTVVLVRNGNIVSLTCFDKGLKKKKNAFKLETTCLFF